MAREVTYRYIDPLTQVWIETARRIGLRVVRTADAYAATDGRGTLAIGDDASLDADDSLAQMIFHELCHSLVEGEQSFGLLDWGMEASELGGPDHDWREHACLRVQYVLTGRHGLQRLFAPTTEFRAFWDQLGTSSPGASMSDDVLSDRTDRSVQAAILGIRRADQPPWAPHLSTALATTARIAAEAAKYTRENEPDVLWAGELAPPAPHPTGLPPRTPFVVPASWPPSGPSPANPSCSASRSASTSSSPSSSASSPQLATCGTCAWRFEQRGVAKCRHTSSRLDDAWPACERYEAALDCQTCGACCRAAYHSVEVAKRDPVVKKQPSFVVDRGTYLEIRREGDRCAALAGGDFVDGKATRFHCVIYDDRPRTCRDFTLGSEHCLTARRRVGLSL